MFSGVSGIRGCVALLCKLPTQDTGTRPAVTDYAVTAGGTLWHFMCGRGTQEKVYGDLKGGFAFDCLRTQRYHSNSARQVFSLMAFNRMIAVQLGSKERRSKNRNQRRIRPFQTNQTLRPGFISRAGWLVQPRGRHILDFGNDTMVHEHFKTIVGAFDA